MTVKRMDNVLIAQAGARAARGSRLLGVLPKM